MAAETCLSRPVLSERQYSGLVSCDKSLPIQHLRHTVIEKSFSGGYRALVVPARNALALDRKAFGRNVARLFDDLCARDPSTTARSVAAAIGVGEDKVSKWRSGSLAVPRTPTLIKIAICFGVSVDVLLDGVTDLYRPTQIGVSEKSETMTLPVAKNVAQYAGVASASPSGTTAHALPTPRLSESEPDRIAQEISVQTRTEELAVTEIVDCTRRILALATGVLGPHLRSPAPRPATADRPPRAPSVGTRRARKPKRSGKPKRAKSA